MKSKQLTPNISTVIVMALFLAAFTVPMNIQAAVYEGIEDPNLKEADSTVEPSITTEALSVPSIGGPDFGGYYYLDNQEPDGPAFDWIEISGTGTNLNLADDSYSSAINLFASAARCRLCVDNCGSETYPAVGKYTALPTSPLPGSPNPASSIRFAGQ